MAFFAALLLSLWTAACGGGGSVPAPPPPTGNFSNASLKGQYAFSMSGEDGVTGSFFARVGSFTADGNGNITAGIEDVNTALDGPQTITFPAASTYSIQADGRGILNINGSGPLSFSITMLSPTQGLIVQTDLNATASGTFFLQSSSAFNTNSLQGNYAFDFSGLDPGGAPDSIVGQLVSNGSGGLTGVLDENDNAVSSGAVTFSGASYQLDATNGPTFGRGLMTFTANGFTFNYVFYIVNSSRIRFIETGSAALTVGDALAQTSVPTTAANFNGNFVFLLNGNGTTGPITRVGRFTADGNGGLTSLFADTNDAGTVAQVPKGSLSAATYTIDQTLPGSGRGTLTFTDSSLGKFSFIFYLTSASGGVIQDVSVNNNKGNVGDGTLQLQTGAPFSSIGGDYGLNFTGVSNNSSTQITGEEDFVGHLNVPSSGGTVSGAVDFSEFSSNQGAFFNVAVSGTGFTIGGDGTTSTGTRNALSLKLNSSPSSTLNFAPYFVDAQHLVVAGTDSNRVISGVITLQAP